jgi:hypothetical protein
VARSRAANVELTDLAAGKTPEPTVSEIDVGGLQQRGWTDVGVMRGLVDGKIKLVPGPTTPQRPTNQHGAKRLGAERRAGA